MKRKEYITPELEDMGDFNTITRNSFDGLNFDGEFPEDDFDIFS